MSKLIPSSLLVLGLTACSGSGSGSGNPAQVQGLQAPQQVAIVEAAGNSTSTVLLESRLLPVAGSDYESDQTRYWIKDDSMQALDTVNSILGSLRQTRYWEQTNAGPYRALVAEEERGGGERGNNATEYEEWIVTSTRASNTSSQLVSFWIEQKETMGEPTPSMIYGSLIVTEEPSTDQPLGQFTLYFKNLPLTEPSTSTDTSFEGYLRTVARTDGQSEVEFYMSHGDVDGTPATGETAMRDRVHVVGNPDDDTGRAFTETRFKANNGTIISDGGEFEIQFNSDYLARRDVENGNTLAVLDRNDFSTRVYQYGVYDGTTEDRIEQLGGFPIEDLNGENGWAGFYGIWFPEGTTLANGQTVVRRSFEDNSTTPYTLFISNGRLEKRSRESLTLGDLIDEELELFDPNAGQELRVMWTGQDFVKTGSRNGQSWTPINPPQSIASSYTSGDWISCWSQARGQVEWAWPASLVNSTPAFVWQSVTINADSPEMASGDLTLHAYFNMLRANITSNQANFQNSESPYLPDATSVSSGNQTYTFNKQTLLLMNGSDPVTLADGVTVTQGPAMFGLGCGPMFSTALTSLGDINSQTTTYQWHTGTNEWNQLRTIKDSNGDFVQFDAPIRMSYTHQQTGSPFNNRAFYLEWDGNHLGGIPWEQESGSNNYLPVFNIPSGSTVTSGNTTYKIKQLEGEQVMIEVGSPSTVYAAQGFDIDGTPITKPTAAPYRDPAIGARPSVESAPKYVGGVPQAASND